MGGTTKSAREVEHTGSVRSRPLFVGVGNVLHPLIHDIAEIRIGHPPVLVIHRAGSKLFRSFPTNLGIISTMPIDRVVDALHGLGLVRVYPRDLRARISLIRLPRFISRNL